MYIEYSSSSGLSWLYKRDNDKWMEYYETDDGHIVNYRDIYTLKNPTAIEGDRFLWDGYQVYVLYNNKFYMLDDNANRADEVTMYTDREHTIEVDIDEYLADTSIPLYPSNSDSSVGFMTRNLYKSEDVSIKYYKYVVLLNGKLYRFYFGHPWVESTDDIEPIGDLKEILTSNDNPVSAVYADGTTVYGVSDDWGSDRASPLEIYEASDPEYDYYYGRNFTQNADSITIDDIEYPIYTGTIGYYEGWVEKQEPEEKTEGLNVLVTSKSIYESNKNDLGLVDGATVVLGEEEKSALYRHGVNTDIYKPVYIDNLRPDIPVQYDETNDRLYSTDTLAIATLGADEVLVGDYHVVPQLDDQESGVVLYDKNTETYKTTKDLNITSLNVVDRIVVAGISYLNGDVIADKNVTVHGDLVVDGTTYTTEEQSLDTTSDYVILRQNEKSGLSNTEKSGVVVTNYNGNGSNAAIGVDHDGIWRVSDNAEENTTSYSNISRFGTIWYQGLSEDVVEHPIVTGATIARDADELSDCVWYDNKYFYHDNISWFELSLVDDKLYFDVESPITDEDLIAVLDGLEKKNLEYYRSLSVMVVSDTTTPTLSYTNKVAIRNKDLDNYGGVADWYTLYSYTNSNGILTIDWSMVTTVPETYTRTSYEQIFDYFDTHWGRVYIDLDDMTTYVHIDADDRWYSFTAIDYNVEDKTDLQDIFLNRVEVTDEDLIQKLNKSPSEDNSIRYFNIYSSIVYTGQTIANNQPILTRVESSELSNNQILAWDESHNRAIGVTVPSMNNTYLRAKVTEDDISYDWASGGGNGVAFIGTMAEYETAKQIAEGNDGYIPAGSLVIITDADTDYLQGEDVE